MYCHIAWPKKDSREKIILSCTISPGSSVAYTLTKDWGSLCETFARGELGKIACRKVSADIFCDIEDVFFFIFELLINDCGC